MHYETRIEDGQYVTHMASPYAAADKIKAARLKSAQGDGDQLKFALECVDALRRETTTTTGVRGLSRVQRWQKVLSAPARRRAPGNDEG